MPPVESDADLESFFREEEFAISVETPRGQFSAVFDNAYQQAFDAPAIEGAAPVLSCRTSNVEDLKLVKGDPVVVDETLPDGTHRRTNYRYLRHQPDGTGTSVLILGK
jgi:hypothetical protein